MSTVVDLGGLGSRGFVIVGAAAHDEAGWSISNAGDVNGDGFDDIIIGAPYNDAGGLNSGSAYVIYGRAGGFGPIDLANLSPDQGFRIQGTHEAGLSVSGAGDVNGDGFADVIVATYSRGQLGYGLATAYVVLGKASHPTTIDLANFTGSDGFKVGDIHESSYYGGFAMSVSSAGDVNGDGFDDIIVGGRYANGEKGVAYVIFGKGGIPGNVDLANLAPTAGFAILGGALADQMGTSVASAGDINHDGFDDVIVGAPLGDAGGSNAGQAYVIFGKATGFSPIDVATLNGTAGFIIKGHNPEDFTGISVSSAGDINGDGFDDIIIGSPNSSTDAAYVIFGKANGFGTVDLGNLSPSAGFMIQTTSSLPPATPSSAGSSVSAAGDVNHDGFDDIVISAPGANRAYVIFGHAGSFSTVDLPNLAPAAGFILQGGLTIDAVSGGGDINHDGFADLLVSAPFGGNGAGQVFVVSGNSTLAGSRNDFNGDGPSDLLWRNDDGTVTDWLGQANGTLATTAAYNNVPASWHIAGTGNFNGDGRADLLWRNDDGTVTDWLGLANGSFASNPVYYNVPNSWHVAGTGDFNGDGRSDVLWQNDDGTITDWLGQGNGGLSSNLVYYPLPSGWHIAGTGDLDGDGRSDILLRNDNGTITDWLGQSNGSFTTTSIFYSVPNSWHVAGVADFNGDGRDDLLWRNDDGTVTDWLGQLGGGLSSNSLYYSAPNSMHIVSTGDFNGDGRDDILWRTDSGAVTDWLGQANGGFVNNAATFSTNVPAAWHVQDPFV